MNTSSKYNAVRTQAFNTINAIRDAELALTKLSNLVEQAGMQPPNRTDKESDVAWIGKVAANATELYHDALKAEALTQVNARIEGKTALPSTPTSWIGRKLNSLATAIG